MLNCFEEISQNLAFFGFCSVVKMMLVEYTLNFKTLQTHLIMVAMATYFSPRFL
jgi:hypothetical protein